MSGPGPHPSSGSDDHTKDREAAPAREASTADERLLLLQRLREAREKKGWSLEDLSDHTRISLHVLSGLESGDFHIVEAPSMRAFLRLYARHVGVPVEEVISVFPEPKTLVEIPPPEEADRSIPIVPRSRVPWRTVLRVGAVVAILAGVWWWAPWSRREPSPRNAARPAEHVPDTALAARQRSDSLAGLAYSDTMSSAAAGSLPAEPIGEPVLRPIAPPMATSTSASIRRPPLAAAQELVRQLTIKANDTVWVQLAGKDSSIIYDAIMTGGIQQQWTVTDTIHVVIGRWWATEVMLDGRAVEVPHGSRDATSFLCTPSGISRR